MFRTSSFGLQKIYAWKVVGLGGINAQRHIVPLVSALIKPKKT